MKKPRSRVKPLRRPNSLRLSFDTLEDRVSLGDAILSSALGMGALGAALLGNNQPSPLAISGEPNSGPAAPVSDLPAETLTSPTFTTTSAVSPSYGSSQIITGDNPGTSTDQSTSDDPFANGGSPGVASTGGAAPAAASGTSAAADGAGNGAGSADGYNTTDSGAGGGKTSQATAGALDQAAIQAGNLGRGTVNTKSTPRVAPPPAASAPPNGTGNAGTGKGSAPNGNGSAPLNGTDGAGTGKAPAPNGGAAGNATASMDDPAAQLRELLSRGDKYQPGLAGEDADLDARVQAILQSQNPTGSNGVNSALFSNAASPNNASRPLDDPSFSVHGPVMDPGAPGSFTVTTQEYDFGTTAWDPVSIAGTGRVELTASVTAPTVLTGQRPVLVFLHGNHSSTYNPTTGQSFFVWPPGAGQVPLPNYRGYQYLADNLASHGYVVVSVSADGVNVLGGTNMVPRAELMHRTLQILRDLNATGTVTGTPQDSIDSLPLDQRRPFGDRFVGHLDLQNIGLMGHSRGGDGVVATYQYETGVNLGSGLPVLPPDQRFPIKAVLPLAPVDFTARTINNVPLMVILPYEDGDVSDLQGQRFYDRARYNLPGDTAPKHVITVFGANHNSFNTVWWAEPAIRFPAGAFDDGAGAPRLTPQEQRSVALAYFGAFFQTYVGNAEQPVRQQFFRNLTGDAPVPPSVITPANPVLAGGLFQQFHPADSLNSRLDVNRLLSAAALTTNQLGGAVTSSGITATFSTAGLQGVASAQLAWTSSGGFWQNAIPAAQADVSRYSHLQFRVSNLSATLQNFSVVLTDGAGNSASTTVNAHYTDPDPARRTPLYNRTALTPTRNVLNTAAIPLSAFSGVNLTDVRSVRFVFDQTSSGTILVNDLMFANRSLGFQVSSTSPGTGAIVSTPPTSFVVSFSDPYDPATLDASDLRVNGIPADAVMATGPITATFTYTSSPVTAEGLQTIHINAGALTRLSDGEPLGAFDTTFRFDAVPLTVVSTTPAVGSTVPLPFTQLDVTFSEPIDPASAGTADLTLSQGTVTAATVIDPTTVRYTLSGITTEGTLTVTIPAGALTDAFGNPGTAFTGSYTLDIGTVPITNLSPENPRGALVYTATATGVIAPADDTDSFTVDLSANQTIAVVVRPTSTSLRPSVELRDASGTVVGSATAPAANQPAAIQAVPVGSGGLFTVSVSGAAGTTGNYSVRIILNASLEDETFGGSSDDTPATAQDLGPAFLSLNGTAQRAAVIGQTGGISTAHPIWAGIPNPLGLTLDGSIGVSTLGLRATGTGQALGRFPNGDDAVILGNGGRTLLSQMPYLITNAAVRVPFAQNEISFLIGGLTAPRVLYFSDVSPTGPDVYLQALTNLGITPTVVPQSSTSAPTTYPDFVTQLTAGGWDLVIFQQRFWFSDTVVTPIVNYVNGGGRFLWNTWNRTQVFPAMAPVFTAFGASTTGNANQTSINQVGSFTPVPDYYSFSLSAGQSVTLALQAGSGVSLELRGPGDTLLALGRTGTTNLTQVVSNFLATQSGTYYARVSGTGTGLDYTLVATRNADLDTEPNNEFLARASQPLGPPVDGVQTALGNVIAGGGSTAGARVLYFSDVSPAGPDPYLAAFTSLGITPTIVPQSSTSAPTTYPDFVTQLTAGGWDLVVFQQRFWFDASVVTPIVNYVNGGGRFLWSTWNRTTVFPAMAPVFAAFGASDTGNTNQTVLTQIAPSPIWDGIPNPLTFTLNGSIGVSTLGLRATTGQAIGRWANGDDAVVIGAGGRTVLTGYMPYLAPAAVATQLARNEVSALLSGFSDSDVYQFRAGANQTIHVETSTPLGGPGLPGNTLDPMILLYDSEGNLVAMDDNSAADGRNASLNYTVPDGGAGLYFVEVRGVNGTQGEYILTVQKNESGSGLPAFEVTSTTPPDKALLRVAPTTLTVTFNTNILLTTLDASDLLIDGQPATAVSVVNGTTVIFTLPTGLSEGLHLVSIPEGAIQATDGTNLTAFNGRFVLDTIGPRVILSSISEGDVLPVGTVTYTIGFDEPLDPARVVPAAWTLRGNDLARTYTPASFSYASDTSVLTITYTGLPEDRYTLTFTSGGTTGLQDLAGNPLDGETVVGGVSVFPIPPGRSGDGTPGGNFVVNFILDTTTAAFPTLTQLAPQGSLIYQGQVQAGVAPASDTDNYTLALDAGQTITVLVTPGAGLRPSVEVRAPDGSLLSSITAPAAGQAALLQTVPAVAAGTYTLTVSGASGTGVYTARVTLNAALEEEGNGGGSNDSRATAQNLDPAFTALPKGASRAAVIGRTDLATTNYTATAATPTFEDIGTTGTILTDLLGADDAFTQITAAQLSGFTFNFYGQTYNTLFVSSNGLITFGSGTTAFTNTDLTTAPTQATIAPYWDDLILDDSGASVRWQLIGTGASRHLVVQWNNVAYFAGGSSTLTFQAVLNADGSMQFNYRNLSGGVSGSDEGRSATVGVKDTGSQGPNRLLLAFNNGPNQFVGNNRSTRLDPPPGGFPPPPPPPFAATAVTPVVFEDIGTTGTVITALQGVDDAFAQITTAQLGGFTFPFFGTTYNTLFVSSNGIITFTAGDATFTNTDLTTVPSVPTIAPYWDDFLIPADSATGSVRFQVIGTGSAQHLVVQWTNVQYFAGGSSTLTFQAVLNADGSVQFNYRNLSGGVSGSDEGRSATVGVKAAGPQGPNRLLVHFNMPPTELVGNNRSTRLTPQMVPPPPPLPSDYYSLTLDAGQTVTLGVTGTNVLLELQDANGMVVATGRSLTTNLNQVINNFRATTAGTYYAAVRGAAGTMGVNYTLVVTRNADFDTERNDTAATAQDITGTVGALGHVVGGGGSTAGARVLYFSDVSPAGTDPYLQALTSLGITPTVVPQSSTSAPDTYPQFVTQLTAGGWDLVIFQQRFWFDASVVTPMVDYVSSGGRIIWSTWNRTQVFAQMAPVFAAFGASTTGNTNQTVLTQIASPIWAGIPDPLTFTLDGTIGVSTLGLTATTGTALGRWANNEVAVVAGNNGRTLLTGYMPYLAGAVATQLAQNEISTVLGGVSDDDWYRVDATEGQVLMFDTTTPGDGPGEFGNALDPHIELYGPDGTLIATGEVLADGRNERIVFTVPAGGAGTYRIRVSAENGTRGEYFLDPEDLAAAGTDGARLAAAPTAVFSFETPAVPGNLGGSEAFDSADGLAVALAGLNRGSLVPSGSSVDQPSFASHDEAVWANGAWQAAPVADADAADLSALALEGRTRDDLFADLFGDSHDAVIDQLAWEQAAGQNPHG